MNTVDATGSIRFTREDETNNSMPFFDAKFTRKFNDNVNSTVYRKNKCETITSDEGDKDEY